MAVKREKEFLGSGVSPGVVFGQALKLDNRNRAILKMRVDDVEEEIRRLLNAIEQSKAQLAVLKSRLEEKIGSEHSVILDTHILILEDQTLRNEILDGIRKERANSEWAVTRAMKRIVRAYESLEDEYFREKHNDIEDVMERVLLNLSGDRPFSWDNLPGDLILVSRDFHPSAFATMDLQKVRGLVLELGGRTSHTAIISRGLRLPAVMGIRDILPSITTGDALIVNGDDGQVILNPTQKRMQRMRGRIEAFGTTASYVLEKSGQTTLTRDGTAVSLRANTELPYELEAAKRCGAEGIGLFRSELLFFGHPQGLPSVEEQCSSYRELVREMKPHTVAIRTLDAGSEKVFDGEDYSGQDNSAMGLRGIRLSLKAKDMFRSQIEAILRSSSDGNIEIVLPMVSTVEEIWQAKSLISEVRESLRENSDLELRKVPVGAMIEVPAAVFSLEVLAKEVDFLCVGTNDLIQYMLAVDRENPHVAYLFQPLHPTVLHCLARIADVAANLKTPARICGEISSNPFYAVLLLGMGYTQLSMNPLSIPAIRRVLHEVSIDDSRRIAEKALTFVTAHEVCRYLTDAVSKLVKTDLAYYAREIAAPNGKS
ncbi:MAG: phosphoenolpyruvate--protein phosphotransferase [Acidobacteria bacterium]|nr:phosphoenolpyruvate--protein phosphotransferase [Acidobacteriota bacterium]